MNKVRTTIFHPLHGRLGAKFGEFAGYRMPLTYADLGATAEHVATRTSAGLFDVSHMAVVDLVGPDPAAALETLVPGGITTLKPGRSRYTFFTNEAGGILDDLIATQFGDRFSVVVNASRAEHDIGHLQLLTDIEVVRRSDLHLVAIQGPQAVELAADAGIDASALTFMGAMVATIDGHDVAVTRSGYTGEDGLELALPAEIALGFAEQLLSDERCTPAGLVARDSLRLEAGLCLYGNDLDETTTPVEADLMWAIPSRRRAAADYPGADVVDRQLADGPGRVRVGIGTDQRRPVRPGNELLVDGAAIGLVTSGAFGPTVDRPVAMGYVDPAHAEPGTALTADVRGKEVPVHVAPLPFAPHRYHRG
ncbi:MAG: glycine cleavage system aminomethyltransferase GcvT [Acidimicrobiales bacterium]|nr:glycine cleavage system aminomethyltransferase GcvT [Acidimicrobiales bacterium]